MRNPSFQIWAGWLAATVAAALTLSAFAFTTFETKDEAKEKKQDIIKSLDEIKVELHEIHKEMKDL